MYATAVALGHPRVISHREIRADLRMCTEACTSPMPDACGWHNRDMQSALTCPKAPVKILEIEKEIGIEASDRFERTSRKQNRAAADGLDEPRVLPGQVCWLASVELRVAAGDQSKAMPETLDAVRVGRF